MGFLKRLFSKTANIKEESAIELIDRYINDDEERRKFVSSSLLQMKELSTDIDNLQSEYNIVTEYLNDCDELDRIPEEIRRPLRENVEEILRIREDKKKYFAEEPKMDDILYDKMDRLSEEMPEAYNKVKDTEDFQHMIKSDLKKVEGEKQAYIYRRNEMNRFFKNISGILVISTIAAFICFSLLAFLGLYLEMSVKLGFLLTVTILIAVYSILFLKGNEYKKEAVKIEKTIIKLIQLQNSVKIRLVNNTNLLDYLYIKYDIYSSDELKADYDVYLEEKSRREQYERASRDLPLAKRELLQRLNKLPIKDPIYWVHTPEAVIDKNERIEIRHELILRRQNLRSQIDENTKSAEGLKNDLKTLIEKYPKYSVELMEMMKELN